VSFAVPPFLPRKSATSAAKNRGPVVSTLGAVLVIPNVEMNCF
jgi:hypothetical protein